MFPHIPQGQPGFVDEPGCPSASGTEAFILGLEKNPCLLSMLPVMRVLSKQKIRPTNLVLLREGCLNLGGNVMHCWLFVIMPMLQAGDNHFADAWVGVV